MQQKNAVLKFLIAGKASSARIHQDCSALFKYSILSFSRASKMCKNFQEGWKSVVAVITDAHGCVMA